MGPRAVHRHPQGRRSVQRGVRAPAVGAAEGVDDAVRPQGARHRQMALQRRRAVGRRAHRRGAGFLRRQRWAKPAGAVRRALELPPPTRLPHPPEPPRRAVPAGVRAAVRRHLRGPPARAAGHGGRARRLDHQADQVGRAAEVDGEEPEHRL
ncbi:hypothetical protein DFJ74DRAFT_692000 [Hyaloraphidium curvatum]|nr:hypothetical protein DFJ74DRAFT_692000 [Hyaloraphidium curvatum]